MKVEEKNEIYQVRLDSEHERDERKRRKGKKEWKKDIRRGKEKSWIKKEEKKENEYVNLKV